MIDLNSIFQGRLTDYKWKQLGEYLKGRNILAGKGIRVENSSSVGTLISALPVEEIAQTEAPPFSVRRIREVSSTSYAFELQEGWVIERKTAASANSIQFHEVSISGQPMSTKPRPEITVQQNEFVYVAYQTNAEGLVTTSTPSIYISSDDKTSQHHQPPSGQSSGGAAYGTGGNYFIKLFKLTIEEGGPKITVYQQSDIEHTRLPTFQNVGGERYIHKQWNGTDDRYDFRTLKQFELSSGTTYGKVIVDAQGNEFDAANDAIKFSAIAQRADSDDPQVKVDDNGGGTITITGNDVDRVIEFYDCDGVLVGEMEFKDGLLLGANQTDVDTSGFPHYAISVGKCGS